MMEVRNVRRATIDRWLQLARLPFDAVAHLLPSDHGSRNAAMLVIDRADVSVRAAVGGLLHDDDLRADAFRRRAGRRRARTGDRAAYRGRGESTVADAELAEELEGAARFREQAADEAEARLRQADAQRLEQQRRVQQVAGAQELAIELAREEQLAVEDKQAKRERLNVLDDQADALDQEADALAAREEAQRLRDAAAAAKAARKGTE